MKLVATQPGVTVGETLTADEVRVLRELVPQEKLCVLGLNTSIRVEADALGKLPVDDACRVRRRPC